MAHLLPCLLGAEYATGHQNGSICSTMLLSQFTLGNRAKTPWSAPTLLCAKRNPSLESSSNAVIEPSDRISHISTLLGRATSGNAG